MSMFHKNPLSIPSILSIFSLNLTRPCDTIANMRPTTRKEVLKILTEPRTVQELADILGVHYQTAYRYIRELKGEKDVVELPVPREHGQLVYVKNTGDLKDGAIRVVLNQKLVTIPDLIKRMVTSPNINERYAGVLAQQYVHCHVTHESDPALSARGGGYSGSEHKAQFRFILTAMRAFLKAGEQLLDQEELWGDSRSCAALYGEGIDLTTMLQIAEPYLLWTDEEIKARGRKASPTP